MHKRTKKFFKRIINKDKPKPVIYRMRSFAEFFKLPKINRNKYDRR